MTAAPPHPAVAVRPTEGPTAAAARQRRLRYRATLAGLRARAVLTPAGSIPRLQVCGAANLLTALGVRVDVVAPATPWPRGRGHRLLVENSAGPLGDLALLVGVPRTAEGWSDVADRVLPLRPSRRAERQVTDAVLCPVTVGFRSAWGVAPRTPDGTVAVRSPVIEVRLLDARNVRRTV